MSDRAITLLPREANGADTCEADRPPQVGAMLVPFQLYAYAVAQTPSLQRVGSAATP
jgi:hypothetical protein